MLSKSICVNLDYRTELHHTTLKNADGTPTRCRVNGKCKVWKTRPEDYRLPVKHGLRRCFYITPTNEAEWEVPELVQTFQNPLNCWVVAQLKQEENVIGFFKHRESVLQCLELIHQCSEALECDLVHGNKYSLLANGVQPDLWLGSHTVLGILSPEGRWYTCPGEELIPWEELYSTEDYPKQFWLESELPAEEIAMPIPDSVNMHMPPAEK